MLHITSYLMADNERLRNARHLLIPFIHFFLLHVHFPHLSNNMLHSLNSPQKIEYSQVCFHCFLIQYGIQRLLHSVIKREYLPSGIPLRSIQQSNIKPLEHLLRKKLHVRRPDCSFKQPDEVMLVHINCRFRKFGRQYF